jgi:hypothetical protein
LNVVEKSVKVGLGEGLIHVVLLERV